VIQISLSDFINLPKYKECEVLTVCISTPASTCQLQIDTHLPCITRVIHSMASRIYCPTRSSKLSRERAPIATRSSSTCWREVTEQPHCRTRLTLAIDALTNRWLEAELQDTPAGTWKFVVGHHPIYSAATHGDTIPLQEDLLPLLVKHRVHAYFSGHDHTLQHHMHTDPHTGWKLHHFVSGGGGYHTGPHELQTKDKYANWDKLVFGASSMGLMSAQVPIGRAGAACMLAR